MPPTLGYKLQQAREQQGLSLADVSHKTRIPISKLQDLEADVYNTFGSPTYARCFLQTYAGFVGVDANPVADHLIAAPLGSAHEHQYLTESLGRWIGAKPGDDRMPAARPVQSSKGPAVMVAVFGVLMIGGVLWANAYLGDRSTPVVESKISPPREAVQNRPVTEEEIRPAIPSRVIVTENARIRKALPVDDEPRRGSKK